MTYLHPSTGDEQPDRQPASEIAPQFQRAIGIAIARSFWEMQGGTHADQVIHDANTGDLQVAFDVLNTPEMQAIRSWIAERAREAADEGWTERQSLSQLPSAVVDWVLS